MKKLIIQNSPVVKIMYEGNVIYAFKMKEIDIYDITNKINKEVIKMVKKDMKFFLWEDIFKSVEKWFNITGTEWEGIEKITPQEYYFDILEWEIDKDGIIKKYKIEVKIEYDIAPLKEIPKAYYWEKK